MSIEKLAEVMHDAAIRYANGHTVDFQHEAREFMLERASQPGSGEAESVPYIRASTAEAKAYVAAMDSRRLTFPLPEGGNVNVVFPCDIHIESINMLAKMLIEMALRQLKDERERDDAARASLDGRREEGK